MDTMAQITIDKDINVNVDADLMTSLVHFLKEVIMELLFGSQYYILWV